ncbi:Uncharacterised protein [Vibrio cholerae]|nr:Uncharacterised protein [Vibrio cholerae]
MKIARPDFASSSASRAVASAEEALSLTLSAVLASSFTAEATCSISISSICALDSA